MKTVWDVKKAFDQDTMVNVMLVGQEKRRMERRRREAEKLARKQKQKRFDWQSIFPACVCR